MILSFKKQFVQKIIDGTKKHTIRLDPHKRWQKGKKIHFATGVRTKNYNCFKEGVCTWNQSIRISPSIKAIWLGLNGREFIINDPLRIELIAKNDGFESSQEFWEWFDKPFYGVLVHWTESAPYV